MFRHIREAARILSYRDKLALHPDQREPKESYVTVRPAGKKITNFIELIVLSLGLGFFGFRALDLVMPHHEILSSRSVSQLVTAGLSLLAYVILERGKNSFLLRLNIGHRLAPYFGHKIDRAYKTLRS